MKAMPLLVLAIAWPAHAQHHADAQVHAAPQSQPAPDPHAAHRATRQSQSVSAAAAHDADTHPAKDASAHAAHAPPAAARSGAHAAHADHDAAAADRHAAHRDASPSPSPGDATTLGAESDAHVDGVPAPGAPAGPAFEAGRPHDAHAGHVRHDTAPDPHAAHRVTPAARARPASVDPNAHYAIPAWSPAEATTQPRTPIPAVTDADRAAAFPPVAGHAAHDRTHHGFLRVDRLEADDADGYATEVTGWYGGDIHRAWLRADAHGDGGGLEAARVELLYGRLVTPWWDVVGGVRADVGEGPSRTWAAVGLQGMAPYKFEVRATAYVGSGGRTAMRVEAEYDTLLTNRWILQWRTEAEAFGRDDPALHRGSGLATVEAGARLRYEITRGFAPYVGLEVDRAFGGTADYRHEDGEAVRDTRIVAGLRLSF